jgi:membrane fusion protein, multidrug efflux system
VAKGGILQPDQNERPTVGPDHRLPAPAEEHKSHKALRIVAWIVIPLIFALGFYLVLRNHDDTKKAAASPRRGAAGGTATVTPTTAKKGDIGVYLDAIGTVTPVYTSSITSQVNGIVTDVHYKEGQLVHKGDLLIEIDPRPYRATLLQAQGVLERDQGVLAQAQMDMDRYQKAWAANAIPKQTLDDQEKVVQQDQGTVKNDQGVVQFDQIQVDFCRIVAPVTGRVGLRLVDPGNVVQSTGGTTLAVVAQIQPITVIFTLPEDSLGQVQPKLGQKSALTVDAYDRTAQKKVATGTLMTLDNQIDTTTGTVKARASFANKDSSLFPNEFVNTRLLVNTLRGVTLIPSSAIQHNGQAAFVYVIQNNAAHLQNIKVGVTDGDTTQVDGINPGDVIANSSFDKLQNNSKVILSNKQAPTGDSGSTAP